MKFMLWYANFILFMFFLNNELMELMEKAVSGTWAAEASAYVSKLKEQKIGYQALKSVDYQVNMVMHESDLSRQQDPVGIFEFNIGDPVNTKVFPRIFDLTSRFLDSPKIWHV